MHWRSLLVLLLLTRPVMAGAEVLVRWDLDEVPPRESLGIPALLVPSSKSAAVQSAVAKGYRVYLELDAPVLPDAALPPSLAGVIVKGASARQLERLRQRLRVHGARVLSVDERGTWPHVRLNWVTLRNNVLQVSSRTAQPWVQSNAVFVRVPGASADAPLLSYPWEPITVADTHQGPGLENYLVAIAEAGSFGTDLVLPLHEAFQRALLLGQPAARADWQQIRRYLEFYSWDLPRRYQRISNIGVMVADPMGSIEILRLLTRHNLPFEIVTAEAVQAGKLESFALAIVLDPAKDTLLPRLSEFARKGGTVVLNGPARDITWEGGAPLVKDDRHVSYRLGEGRVLQLQEEISDPDEFARDIREVLGPDRRVVDVWNGITVLVSPYRDSTGKTSLLTAVNYAHEELPIQVRVQGTFTQAYYESPESDASLLPIQHRNGHTEFVVPALRVGGRVFLSQENAPK